MAAHQAPPSLGFSRQEHWSGLPFPSPMHESEKCKWSRSVVSNAVRPHGLQPTRLLCPWDFPGKSTGVGCHCLLQVTSLLTRTFKKSFSLSLSCNSDSFDLKWIHCLNQMSPSAVIFLTFFFNWRIIALQYCIGLYHISAWISHRYTHVLTPLNPPPSSTHSTPLGCDRALDCSPCVTQQIPTCYLLHVW